MRHHALPTHDAVVRHPVHTSARRYAYASSTRLVVVGTLQPDGSKLYVNRGPLFFGCAMKYHEHFDVNNDPPKVHLVLEEAPMDYSARQAIDRVRALYVEQQKEFDFSVVPRPPPGADPHAPVPSQAEPATSTRPGVRVMKV